MSLDTPSLRGVSATAPYLHDGSAKTLRDVLDGGNHTIAEHRQRDTSDRTLLESYLRGL
jgi:cytochrome c peroxidase